MARIIAGGGKDHRHHVRDPQPRQRETGNRQMMFGRQRRDQQPRRADQPRGAQRLDRAKAVADAVAGKTHNGHRPGKERKAQTRGKGRGPQFLFQIDRRPIQNRAFGHH